MQLTGLGNHMPVGIPVVFWVMVSALPLTGIGLANDHLARR
jgi:hypothetical protein